MHPKKTHEISMKLIQKTTENRDALKIGARLKNADGERNVEQ
jgi:hypothetical protein